MPKDPALKRPAFQFYPGDWLRDTGLRMCSVGARGLWIDMICLMHDGEPYGYLKVGHKVILPVNLARMVGATLQEVEGWLLELEDAAVFSRDPDGAIYSRRMIRDEELRKTRAEGGKKGGNPKLLEGKDNLEVESKVNLKDNLEVESKVNQNQTPAFAFASSSSSSKEKENTNTPLTPQGGNGSDSGFSDSKEEEKPASDPPQDKSDAQKGGKRARPGRKAKSEEYPLPPSLQPFFDEFWSLYARKNGKNDAKKAVHELNPDTDLQQKILAGERRTQKYDKAWIEKDYKHIKLPAGWIRGRRWEDEYDESVDATSDRKAQDAELIARLSREIEESEANQ